MLSLRAPDTLVWPLPLQVSLVAPAGSGSLTATLVAVLGPLLLTTMVYVVLVPGTTAALPSSFVIETSTCGVSVSVSVAVLLAAVVSVTPAGGASVTLLAIEPVAAGSIVPLTVMMMLWPLARLRP